MRLLNIKTLQLETFHGSDLPEYATLSHVWGDNEVTFQDLTIDVARKKKGWNKIFGAATQAQKHSCKYVWIDTCCIDKTSSAELSEAINSMFRWYRKSKLCFAYLEDVSKEPKCKIIEVGSDSEATPPPSPRPALEFLHESRWFKRGWTLQELIAPKTLYFYDVSWNELGEKRQLEKEITEITGIDSDVLRDQKSLYAKSIARRMSWASKRETTRIEDIAYCLMGIFKINMPLLYGEGEKAFIRLQEEIMRSNYDHSLFAWNHRFPNTLFGTGHLSENGPLLGVGLLAPHPVAFRESANIIPHTTKTEPYAVTNRGLRVHLRILKHTLPRSSYPHTHFAILQCGYRNNLSTAIAIPLAQISASKVSESKDEFCRCADQDYVEVKYSQAASLESQNVYFPAAGPLLWSKVSRPFHRCWLRDYGQEQGVVFRKARYREYPIKTWDTDNSSYSWDYENKSMAWAKDWHGSQAALLFFKNDGPAFVVVLTFLHCSDEREHTQMDVHIKQVLDCTRRPTETELRQVVLDRILIEDITLGQELQIAQAQKTLYFEGRVLTVRLKREVIFDEDIFVLDLLFSGVKREFSETTPETFPKRSKGSKARAD